MDPRTAGINEGRPIDMKCALVGVASQTHATVLMVHVLSRLARLGPDLQRAGYAPDKLAEIVRTGGKSWQVLDALDALDALRRDDARLLDCFEPDSLAEIAIQGGPDALNELRHVWPALARLNADTGKYVPLLPADDIYRMACEPDGGKSLRNTASQIAGQKGTLHA